MVNVDNLKVSEEVVNDSEKMKKRLEYINKELNQLNDKDDSNDIVDIKKEYLNSEFADYLIKNKKCDSLKRIVDRLKYGDLNQLGAKAGKGLDDLATFLDDITNPNRMKKDYDEFIKRINQSPKSLSHMGSWEIRRLNLYLGMNEGDALNAYNLMKNKLKGKDWMNDKQDKQFYESVIGNLKSNYQYNESFIVNDYPAIASLEPTAASLKAILGEKWDGKNETIAITKVEDSIVDVNEVIKKVKENNDTRIKKNINLIVDDLSLDVDDFKFDKSNGSFMVNGQLFNIDKMKEIFGKQIVDKVSNMKIDFLGDDDIKQTLDMSYDGIYQKFTKKINQLLESNTKEDSENKGNGDFEDVDIKEGLAVDKINDYLRVNGYKEIFKANKEGKYQCNMKNVKNFLNKVGDGIKFDKKFTEVGTPSRMAWLSAVQILLNKEYEGTLKVDGQYVKGGETYKTVYNLQKNKFGFNGKDLDGIPGPKTLSKLLKNQTVTTESDDGKGIINNQKVDQSDGKGSSVNTDKNDGKGGGNKNSEISYDVYSFKMGKQNNGVGDRVVKNENKEESSGETDEIKEYNRELKSVLEGLLDKYPEFGNLKIMEREGENGKEKILTDGKITVNIDKIFSDEKFCGKDNFKDKIKLMCLSITIYNRLKGQKILALGGGSNDVSEIVAINKESFPGGLSKFGIVYKDASDFMNFYNNLKFYKLSSDNS